MIVAHATQRILLMLSFTTSVVALLSSCAAVAFHEQRLSKAQLDAVLASAGIDDPWQVEQERVRDEETAWVVFVTEKPKPLRGGACVARETVIRVARDAKAINEREERDVVAFEECGSASYDEFRSIDAVGDVRLETIVQLSRLLREDFACSDGNCIQRGVVSYQNDDVRVAFGQLDMGELYNIYVARVGNVRFNVFSRSLAPEMLGCEFQKDASGVWNLRVYRELGPEPVYVN